MSVPLSARCFLYLSCVVQLTSCAPRGTSFRLRDGEFMQPMGTAPSRSLEPSTITAQGQLVAGAWATSLENLRQKLSYNLPVGEWKNRTSRPLAMRPLGDGRVALVGWSSSTGCDAVFICGGPAAEDCTDFAKELPVDCLLDEPVKIHELRNGLVLVTATKVLLWDAEAMLWGRRPVAQWPGNFADSVALSEGLALRSCNATWGACSFIVLHAAVSQLGTHVWMQALRYVSPPDEGNLKAKPAALQDGGLAIVSRFGRRGSCSLGVAMFAASALSSGTSVPANPSGRTQELLPPSDPCEDGLDMIVETVVHNGSEFLLVFSDTAIHRFPVVSGTLGPMSSQVFPLSELPIQPTAVAVLPENVLAVATNEATRLMHFRDGPLSWLGMPLKVRHGGLAVDEMLPWGRRGLCVRDDTYYFFNYSVATWDSAVLWQTTLEAASNLQESRVTNLVGIAGGVAALVLTENAADLVFLRNSTPHGDWRRVVLRSMDSGSAAFSSIVAVSNTILAFCVGEAGNWSFWDLSEPPRRSENSSEVLDAFCTLPAPVRTPNAGRLLGATGQGGLIVANASGLLVLPAAGIRRCDLSYLLHLHSRDSARAYTPMVGMRRGSRAVACCGGGFAVVHSGVRTSGGLQPWDQMSLFNASAAIRGGEPFAELKVDNAWNLITSLFPLEDGGFLAGATSKKVYRYEPAQVRGLVMLNASTAFGIESVPWSLASWSRGPTGSALPEIFVADEVVYRAQSCPEMTYGHWGDCIDCPDFTLSIQGSKSCNFRPGNRIAMALLLGLAVVAVVAVALLAGRSLEPKLLRSAPLGLQSLRALAWACALLPVLGGVVEGIFGPAWFASLLVFLALLGLAIEHWMWRRQGLVEMPASTGLLLWMACNALVISFMFVLDTADLRDRHPQLTMLGLDRGESRCFCILVLATQPVVIVAATAWQAKVRKNALRRPLSRGLLYTEPDGRDTFNYWPHYRCMQRCGCRAVSGCFERTRRLLKSWEGRHWIMVVNAGISATVCLYQYVQSNSGPRDSVLAVVLCFGLLSMFTGILALSSDALRLPEKLDRHFRWSVLWKVDMLASKVVLLAIPQASSVVQMDSIMSCGFDAFCPSDCVNQGGYCARFGNAGSPVCKCSMPEVNWAVYILTAITSFLLCMLRLTDLAAFWSARLTPWRESGLRRLRGALGLIGAAGVNLTSLFFALLVSVAPAECYLLDLSTALVTVLPLVPLTLVANEARWILATWKAHEAQHVLIWSCSGLRILTFLTCAASAASTAHLAWKPTQGLSETCRAVHWSTLGGCFLCAPFSLACSLIRARTPPGSQNAPCEGVADSNTG